MIEIILVVLIVLWFLGFIAIPWLPVNNLQLFVINGHAITLWDALIFLVVIWLIDLLPTPFREISAVLLLLYSLSILGIIAIAGFSNIIVIALILGTVVYLFKKSSL